MVVIRNFENGQLASTLWSMLRSHHMSGFPLRDLFDRVNEPILLRSYTPGVREWRLCTQNQTEVKTTYLLYRFLYCYNMIRESIPLLRFRVVAVFWAVGRTAYGSGTRYITPLLRLRLRNVSWNTNSGHSRGIRVTLMKVVAEFLSSL